MTRKELAELGKRCAEGVCHKCPFYWGRQDMDCRSNLITALSDELEKADLLIPVKSGGSYAENIRCGECRHFIERSGRCIKNDGFFSSGDSCSKGEAK